jgi:hypothetical protein
MRAGYPGAEGMSLHQTLRLSITLRAQTTLSSPSMAPEGYALAEEGIVRRGQAGPHSLTERLKWGSSSIDCYLDGDLFVPCVVSNVLVPQAGCLDELHESAMFMLFPARVVEVLIEEDNAPRGDPIS